MNFNQTVTTLEKFIAEHKDNLDDLGVLGHMEDCLSDARWKYSRLEESASEEYPSQSDYEQHALGSVHLGINTKQ